MQQKTLDFNLINKHLNLGECSWTKLDQGLCEKAILPVTEILLQAQRLCFCLVCNWIVYLWSLQETDYSTSLQLLHASLGMKLLKLKNWNKNPFWIKSGWNLRGEWH